MSAQLDVPLSPAQWDVMQIEALYQTSLKRRLSNSETDEMFTIAARVAERAEREARSRVPEYGPFQYSPRYW